MTKYLFLKEDHFRLDKANYVQRETKYCCEVLDDGVQRYVGLIPIEGSGRHPFTSTSPLDLFNQIADEFEKGDIIKTLSESNISTGFTGAITLSQPLSSDELKILTVQILKVLGKKD